MSQMFCYQCEQTANGTGCNITGVCGKDPETAALQDILLYTAESVSKYAVLGKKVGIKDEAADLFVVKALFTTVTNVNFDPERIAEMVYQGAKIRDKLRKFYLDACNKTCISADKADEHADWVPATDIKGLVEQGKAISIEK